MFIIFSFFLICYAAHYKCVDGHNKSLHESAESKSGAKVVKNELS